LKANLYNTQRSLICYYVAHLHYFYFSGTDKVRDPCGLRQQLAVNRIVEMHEKADAVEILNYLLTQIHSSTVAEACADPTNEACGDSCPAHRSFRLELMEQSVCLCGENSEPKPWDFCSFVYPLHVDELLAQSKAKFLHWEESIGKLQDCYSGTQVTEQCFRIPQQCRRAEKKFSLLNAPEVLFLGLTGQWDSLLLNGRKVMQISSLFPGILPITTLFPQAAKANYRLRSWIAFGLGHYFAYIRHSVQDVWFKFEDEKIKRMGEYYTCLKDEIESNFHPVAMFYEKTVETGQTFSSYAEVEKWETVEERVREIESRNGIATTIRTTPSTKWEWSCATCTLNNPSESNVCSACSNPRPARSLSNSQAPTIAISPRSASSLHNSTSARSPLFAKEATSPFHGSNQLVQSYSPGLSKSVAYSSPRPVLAFCPKCRGRYPSDKTCECTLIASRFTDNKLVCPGCTLLVMPTVSVCTNCDKKLILPGIPQPCLRCHRGITGKGVCLTCSVEVASSPCVYCGDSQFLVCLVCAAPELARSI